MTAVMAGDADNAVRQRRARFGIAGIFLPDMRRISSSLTCFKRNWKDATSPPPSASFSTPEKSVGAMRGGEIR
jgi:hypothetical protein